jgi:ribonucleoside-diphosphate reductase alpha chain/ribonucleoside-triphosphate reductase
MEPVVRFDGSLDQSTIVVDFYVKSPDGMPVADKNWDTWKQLEAVKMANKYWADQSVSCSIYYKKDDIPKIKEWLRLNWCDLKTISFLCHSDHGFKQAPKETITEKQFNTLSKKIKPLDLDSKSYSGELIEGLECEGGVCPIR